MKRGVISFTNIDETRFTLVDGFRCLPFFLKGSWGLFRRRTKLLCRKCGNRIGVAYDDHAPSSYSLAYDESEVPTTKEAPSHRKYDIKIRSLQPSTSDDSGVPFFSWYIKATSFQMIDHQLAAENKAEIASGPFKLFIVYVMLLTLLLLFLLTLLISWNLYISAYTFLGTYQISLWVKVSANFDCSRWNEINCFL